MAAQKFRHLNDSRTGPRAFSYCATNPSIWSAVGGWTRRPRISAALVRSNRSKIALALSQRLRSEALSLVISWNGLLSVKIDDRPNQKLALIRTWKRGPTVSAEDLGATTCSSVSSQMYAFSYAAACAIFEPPVSMMTAAVRRWVVSGETRPGCRYGRAESTFSANACWSGLRARESRGATRPWASQVAWSVIVFAMRRLSETSFPPSNASVFL